MDRRERVPLCGGKRQWRADTHQRNTQARLHHQAVCARAARIVLGASVESANGDHRRADPNE